VTDTDTDCRNRWEILVLYTRARGVSEDGLRQLILRPAHRGGAGHAFWTEEKTTAELAEWLRWKVDEMAGQSPSDGGQAP
jgi:hypothetical protein